MDLTQYTLFRRITLDYFAQLSPDGAEPPVLGSPYLRFGDPVALDFTSLVRVSGSCEGYIYISASSAMIQEILKRHGDEDFSENKMLEMSRELSKILAGSAVQASGGTWRVSDADSFTLENFGKLELPEATLNLPLEWLGTRAFIVICLLNREKQAAKVHA